MESMTAGIIGIILLLPLIVINLLVSMGKVFSEKVGGLVSRLVKEEVALSPDKQHHFKHLDRLFLIAWLLVGGGAAIFMLGRVRPAGMLAMVGAVVGAVGIFLAFKSGSILTRFVAYTFHDRALIRQKSGQIALGSLISKAIVPGTVANATFLLAWALLFRVAKIGVNGLGEAGVNWLPIGLWLAGLLFGYVYGVWRSRDDPRFLLKDDLGVVAFMGIMKTDRERQKVERSIATLKERVSVPQPEEVAKETTRLAQGIKDKAPREAKQKLAEEAKKRGKRFRMPKRLKGRQ